MIQLLVSVRNCEEASIAAEHGADIVDVKEPHHGPLGFAGADIVDSVLMKLAGKKQVSAALGEWREWEGSGPCPVVSGQLTFVKLGLAGAAEPLPLDDSWQQALERIRLRIAIAANWTEDCRPQWISVAYADHEAAAAPPPEQVLEHAVQTGSRGLLIDTAVKDGRDVFSCVGLDRLKQLRERCLAAEVQFALAGQIQRQHLQQVQQLQPDILGVRGAVCSDNDRSNSLSAVQVQQFKDALNS